MAAQSIPVKRERAFIRLLLYLANVRQAVRLRWIYPMVEN